MNWIEDAIIKAREQKLEKLDLQSHHYRIVFSPSMSSFDQLVEVPKEVFELSHLTELDLGGHRIEELPEDISNLQNLKKLSLSGNTSVNIGGGLAQLRNLRSLNLTGVVTADKIIAHLPHGLQDLNLSFTNIVSLPESLLALKDLRSLDLVGCRLSRFPSQLVQLEQLSAIRIGDIETLKAGEIAKLGRWKSLRDLTLAGQNIPGKELTKLRSLESLSLWNLDLTLFSPDTFVEFSNLKRLYLSSQEKWVDFRFFIPPTVNALYLSGIGPPDFSDVTLSLENITDLGINSVPLGVIPSGIYCLSKLKSLSITQCDISEIPKEIFDLGRLESLHLSFNPITIIPDEIENLEYLSSLGLNQTRISKLPKTLTKLKNLQQLSLGSTPLNGWPPEIFKLVNLSYLDLEDTGISDLPGEVRALTKLEILDLNRNSIKKIPSDVRHLTHLKMLRIQSESITSPPPEIVERGTAAIQAYFHELVSGEIVRLYEAKLIIVGEGEVGKTCISRKLITPDLNISNESENIRSTRGIEIHQWKLPLPHSDTGQQLTINLWDFGGQEIYHATHQFFLTKRSLYLYVWDARKEDKLGSFDFWLSVVTLLSGGSPIIVALNKADERIKEIDQRSLQEKFPNIVSFHKVSALNNLGMADLEREISRSIVKLPHIGDEWPIKWSKVREMLEAEAAQREYIEIAEYLALCRSVDLTETQAKFLSTYLHDLGVILHFQDDPVLERLVILRPEWGTNAVYAVLDTQKVQLKNGQFTLLDLEEIWGKTGYPSSKYTELLRLMMKFELCFQLGNSRTYIAPELLPSMPPELDWDQENNLRFEYQYDFMPAGLITRFISRQHELIEKNLFWKNGVVLIWEATRALVVMEPFNRKIRVTLCGDDKKALLAVIRRDFLAIHRTLNDPKVVQMIPCSCDECRNGDPFLFDYGRLKHFLAKGEQSIYCDRSVKKVLIRELLEGVFSREEITELAQSQTKGGNANIYIETLISGNNFNMDNNAQQGRLPRSPWVTGTFYLFAVVVVLAALATTAKIFSAWLLVLIIVGGLIFVTVIGALQLKHDARISDANFLKLMQLAFQQLPLLGKLVKTSKADP